MKAKKRTFKLTVRIKNCKQDFGMGKGVIGTQECVLTDELNQGFKGATFLMSLENAKQVAISNFIDVDINVVK